MLQILELLLMSIEHHYYWVGLLTFTFGGLFSFTPLFVAESDDKGMPVYVVCLFRRTAWIVITLYMLLVPIVASVITALLGNAPAGSEIYSLILSIVVNTTIGCTGIYGAGWVFRFFIVRRIKTWRSHILRRLRFNVSGDKESDIRDVIGKLEKTIYNPRKYYKDDAYFVGLNVRSEPQYIPRDQFEETHTEIIGPTRTGKGVVAGCIQEQSIYFGNSVIMHDPKGDKFLPHILKAAAEKMGANFLYFNLNDGMLGQWHPFKGGTSRESRTRLMWALGMKETGSDADFYKLGEKKDIDKLLKSRSWTISDLLKKLSSSPEDRQAKRAISSLTEMTFVDTFNPKSGRGVDWEHILSTEQQQVIYIAGSLDDELITKMHRLLLIELNQYIIRLQKEGQRKRHITQFVDEVAFLTSMELSNALATIAGYNCNLVLAYQATAQLRNIADQNVDKDAVVVSFHTNCQNKIIYRMPEPEEAEWASLQTGEVFKTVKRMEKTEIDETGAETWGDGAYNKVAEQLITPNVFIGLPQMVGVLIVPNQLASIVCTSFVPTQLETDFSKLPYKLEEQGPEEKEEDNTDKDKSKVEAKKQTTNTVPAKKAEPKAKAPASRKAAEKKPAKKASTAKLLELEDDLLDDISLDDLNDNIEDSAKPERKTFEPSDFEDIDFPETNT